MYSAHTSDHEHGLGLHAALDFLNTLELVSGLPVDHLHEPADARTWFVEHGILHAAGQPAWSDADLGRVRDVRDALREVIDAVVEARHPGHAAVDLVNGALAAGSSPRLELEGTTIRVGHRHAASAVDEALAAVAAPIVEELGSGRPDRFRTCANDTCRWAFYDTSPTGRRRWCDMKVCGNRAKAARHRARLAKTETSASASA